MRITTVLVHAFGTYTQKVNHATQRIATHAPARAAFARNVKEIVNHMKASPYTSDFDRRDIEARLEAFEQSPGVFTAGKVFEGVRNARASAERGRAGIGPICNPGSWNREVYTQYQRIIDSAHALKYAPWLK
mgnify:CR=1 FL=1